MLYRPHRTISTSTVSKHFIIISSHGEGGEPGRLIIKASPPATPKGFALGRRGDEGRLEPGRSPVVGSRSPKKRTLKFSGRPYAVQ